MVKTIKIGFNPSSWNHEKANTHGSLTMFVLTFPKGHREEAANFHIDGVWREKFPRAASEELAVRNCSQKRMEHSANEVQPHYYKLRASQVYKFDALHLGLPRNDTPSETWIFAPKWAQVAALAFYYFHRHEY